MTVSSSSSPRPGPQLQGARHRGRREPARRQRLARLVCGSAGNLGQALAWSGRARGLEVDGRGIPVCTCGQLDRIRALGAKTGVSGRGQQMARAAPQPSRAMTASGCLITASTMKAVRVRRPLAWNWREAVVVRRCADRSRGRSAGYRCRACHESPSPDVEVIAVHPADLRDYTFVASAARCRHRLD